MRRPLMIVLAGAALTLSACAASTGTASTTGTADVAGGGQAATTDAGAVGDAAHGITVTGEGRVSGTPDTLTATVGVEVTRSTVQQALDETNTAAGKVIDAVKQAGVAAEDIQTRNVSIQPRYEQPGPDKTPVITGYTVSNLVEIKVRALDRAGEVLQAAAGAGGDATRVQGVTFSLEDNQQLLSSAREQAFTDAKQKAEQYASLAGRSLGALVSVSETTNSTVPRPYYDTTAGAGEAASMPIEPGQQEVSVQVTAVWAMS